MTTTEADTRENGQVYEDHALELTRYATVLVGPDDAPDIVTDAVLNAFASPNWRRVENRRAYLFRSVLNHANSFHRSGSRRRRREALSIVRDQPLRSRPDGGSHSINLATGVATRLTGAISGTLSSPTEGSLTTNLGTPTARKPVLWAFEYRTGTQTPREARRGT